MLFVQDGTFFIAQEDGADVGGFNVDDSVGRIGIYSCLKRMHLAVVDARIFTDIERDVVALLCRSVFCSHGDGESHKGVVACYGVCLNNGVVSFCEKEDLGIAEVVGSGKGLAVFEIVFSEIGDSVAVDGDVVQPGTVDKFDVIDGDGVVGGTGTGLCVGGERHEDVGWRRGPVFNERDFDECPIIGVG